MPGPDREYLMGEVARLERVLTDADVRADRLETAARAYIEGHELALTRAETAEAALAAARRECEGLRAKMTELAEALASAADDIDSRDTEGFREALREGAAAATEVAE